MARRKVTPNQIPEYVVWLDHHEPQSDNVWWSPEEHTTITGPMQVETVGYIIREEDTWLAIAMQLTEDGYTGQPLVLIKSCIIHRQPLKLS